MKHTLGYIFCLVFVSLGFLLPYESKATSPVFETRWGDATEPEVWEVHADGTRKQVTENRTTQTQEIRLHSVTGPSFPPSGTEESIILMCAASDAIPDTHTADFFGGMYKIITPYVEDVSYGKLHVTGTAAGWFTMPYSSSIYSMDWDKNSYTAARDCASEATDTGIVLEQFQSIIFVFNMLSSGLPLSAYGGFWCPTSERCWRSAWLPNWAWTSMSVILHEVFHGYGFPHTRGLNGAVYSDPYDVMSHTFSCGIQDPIYGCLPQYTGAYYRHVVSWIPQEAAVQIWPGIQRVILAPSTPPQIQTTATRPTKIVAEVFSEYPNDISGTFGYAIEVRDQIGFDVGIPEAGVVIHKLWYPGSNQTVLIANTRGALAGQPGDVFYDSEAQVEICVRSKNADRTYTVDIANGTGNRCGSTVYVPLVGR